MAVGVCLLRVVVAAAFSSPTYILPPTYPPACPLLFPPTLLAIPSPKHTGAAPLDGQHCWCPWAVRAVPWGGRPAPRHTGAKPCSTQRPQVRGSLKPQTLNICTVLHSELSPPKGLSFQPGLNIKPRARTKNTHKQSGPRCQGPIRMLFSCCTTPTNTTPTAPPYACGAAATLAQNPCLTLQPVVQS